MTITIENRDQTVLISSIILAHLGLRRQRFKNRKTFLNSRQVAKILRVRYEDLAKMRRSSELKHVFIRGRFYYDISDVSKWIQDNDYPILVSKSISSYLN